MKYKIIEKEGKVIVEDIKDFEPAHIFECGQCFRWNKEADGSFTGVAKGRVINVLKDENRVIFNNTNKEEFLNIWVDYFDLNRDYEEIKKRLAKKDSVMKKAIHYGTGIRLLNQDEWEILLSFIISSNRSIPLIKKSIESLCRRYGDFIEEYRGKKYYAFPKLEELLNKSVEEIKESHTGYRAKYIVDTVAIAAERQIEIYNLKKLSTSDAKKQLLKFSGVGPKVADCILLFSMRKFDAFPIDVWVRRIMEYFYFPEGTTLKKLQLFAKEHFGEEAGFAQQYLFYYARELGIGK
ncbi:DNA-3-methyladenine glycosylase family protein [Crassaminicella indica]|uniref:8-oxoguanine DNA glycosylase n=1 Tax=Crassaminicella indica TaxID=2855394 RepID=A0ABX8R870_9CLOT|nr:DNA glycosylase [Crassaminicella indica]QXM05228.1 8-oxoguanine DNA glycosylase [Crassaminicella indica]